VVHARAVVGGKGARVRDVLAERVELMERVERLEAEVNRLRVERVDLSVRLMRLKAVEAAMLSVADTALEARKRLAAEVYR